MRPGAHNAAAADVLDRWLDAPGRRVSEHLQAWGRANRFAGSGDRRAIGDIVYDILRRKSLLTWVSGGDEEAFTGRALVLALAAMKQDFSSRFSGPPYGLAEPDAAELTRLRLDLESAPRPVRLAWPPWLLADAEAHLGEACDDVLRAFWLKAPIFGRINRIRDEETIGLPGAPDTVRVSERIANEEAYLSGRLEVQDLSSQLAVHKAGAKEGQVILDFCAGAGGKALAFASLLRNKARILAYDIAPERMADLPQRAKRAGASSIEPIKEGALSDWQGRCDCVFVDAPCSGSGRWRREADAKWTLTPQKLALFHRSQREALQAGAKYVRQGGRLVYATCSVLASENNEVIEDFLARHSAFFLESRMSLHPLSGPGGGDGFFIARMRRRAGSAIRKM